MKYVYLLLVALGVLMFSNCSRDNEEIIAHFKKGKRDPKIIGVWETDGLIFEYKANGAFKAKYKPKGKLVPDMGQWFYTEGDFIIYLRASQDWKVATDQIKDRYRIRDGKLYLYYESDQNFERPIEIITKK